MPVNCKVEQINDDVKLYQVVQLFPEYHRGLQFSSLDVRKKERKGL